VKVEYINPFVTSAVSVFSTMLGCRLERGKLGLHRDAQPDYEISGTIGLSGKAVGTVVLSLDKPTALSATKAMLGERHEAINDNVIDAVGELTNMIAGAAKAKLEQFDMSVSLPSVIVGRNHVIQFPSRYPPIRIPFHCDWGQLGLVVGLAEVSPPAVAEPSYETV